jgi:outer membrane protein assembly factor BamA
MGGLDNWITSPTVDKFNRTTPINTNNNYAFQTLATPVRGFKQNARNGDKYMVLNSELRIPVFSALMNQPIRSEIIRNFQLVAFVDVGTAWEGLSPFSDTNPLFNEEIPNASENPSVIVRVKRYKTPIILGFGPGFRTTFLSYFIRFDSAWGYDTGEVSKKPMYYFTFGTDF